MSVHTHIRTHLRTHARTHTHTHTHTNIYTHTHTHTHTHIYTHAHTHTHSFFGLCSWSQQLNHNKTLLWRTHTVCQTTGAHTNEANETRARAPHPTSGGMKWNKHF